MHTMIAVIYNGHFWIWCSLMADAIQEYLPDSSATVQGHIKRHKNVLSTHPKPSRHSAHNQTSTSNLDSDLNAQQESHCVNYAFCWSTVVDFIHETIYTNITKTFPALPLMVNFVFLVHDYTTNAILVRSIQVRDKYSITSRAMGSDHSSMYWTIKLPCKDFFQQILHVTVCSLSNSDILKSYY